MNEKRTRVDIALAHFRVIEAAGDSVDAALQYASSQYKAREKTLNLEYRTARRRYEANVALLRLLVLLPFFVLVIVTYHIARTRRSPYQLHFTAALVVAVLLLVRISAEFAWRSSHYYATLGLAVIALAIVLGLILRRHLDIKNLGARRAAVGQCAQCGLGVTLTPGTVPNVTYCPRCGFRVRRECPACGHMMPAFFDHCSECGANQAESGKRE